MTREHNETKPFLCDSPAVGTMFGSVDKETLQTIGLYLKSLIAPSPRATESSAVLNRHTAKGSFQPKSCFCAIHCFDIFRSKKTFSMPYLTSNRTESGTEIIRWQRRQPACTSVIRHVFGRSMELYSEVCIESADR